MEMKFTFKNMESSESIEAYVEKRLRPTLRKYFSVPLFCHFTVQKQNAHYLIKCQVFASKKSHFNATQADTDPYAAIDLIAQKLSTQMRRQKEKVQNKRRSSAKSIFIPSAQPLNDQAAVNG